MNRPTGITVLGILYLLAGIGSIFMAMVFSDLSTSSMDATVFGVFGSGFAGFFAGIFVIIGMIYFTIAGGLFSGKSWGRTIVIVFSIIDLVLQAVSLSFGNFFGLVMILLDLIVLYYMWRPHVMAYFKGQDYQY